MKERLRRVWGSLWRPTPKWALGIPLGALLAVALGAGLMLGSYVTVEATNTGEFCISCHEMGDFIYPEYVESVHYSNASGVRASCPDCHVPKPWIPKMNRKVAATFNELPGHLIGVIDTREKFEAKRWEMAQNVWEDMRENDSMTCRSCHSREAMALEEQDRRARRKHTQEYFEESGKTCIDCHTGVAHVEPEPPLPDLPPTGG